MNESIVDEKEQEKREKKKRKENEKQASKLTRLLLRKHQAV